MSKWFAATILIAALMSSGCATKKYVKTESRAIQSRVEERVTEVEGQVEEVQTRLDRQKKKIGNVEVQAKVASRTAQQALDRAVEAGKLAEGKLLYETVLTDEKVRFATDKSFLSETARTELDSFASGIKAENRNVFVEIQGHTDWTGEEEHNHKLGLARAEQVQRYLNMRHQIPLHRISVISYGEDAPVADNETVDGRAQNRRVVLVVLQ